MNQNLPARFKSFNGFGNNRFRVFRPFPVQNMRKPYRIIFLFKISIFIQIAPVFKSNSPYSE